jgi:hypothetical protein
MREQQGNSPSRRIRGGAVMLGLAAARLAGAQGAIAERPPATEWFMSPCTVDAVNANGWPEYELRGIRISVPAAYRLQKIPNRDELHFRGGQATLRLQVRLDANALFNQYSGPELRVRHCEGPLGGHIAEAVSFRAGLGWYGFVARWPDASGDEWLVAVVMARTLADATALRQTLFTLTFPGEKTPPPF